MLENIPLQHNDEEYRFITGYDYMYAVSNYGNIYSFKSNRLLTLTRHTDTRVDNSICTSYYRVKLRHKGKAKIRTVHRYVAEEFIENPEGKAQVNHIDSNGLNNHISNLEWVTASENVIHAVKAGRHTASNNTLARARLAAGNATRTIKEREHRKSFEGRTLGGSKVVTIAFVAPDRVKLDYALVKCCRCGSNRKVGEATMRKHVLGGNEQLSYCQSCTARYGKYKI